MSVVRSRHILVFLIAFLATVGTAHLVYACSASNPYNGASTFGGRVITSGFGYRNTGIAGASTFHRAYDLRTNPAAGGDPNVTAFRGGTVSTHNIGGYGLTVYVTDGNFRQRYSHAGSISVQDGQTIPSGTSLGDWSTATGLPGIAPHLDLGYEVNVNGEWKKVDPGIAEALIAQGMDPQSAEFAEAATSQTAQRCNVDENALNSKNPSRPGGVPNEMDRMCNINIKERLKIQINANLAKWNDLAMQSFTPPASVAQVANTPCVSKELQNIANKFAYAPSGALGSVQSSLNTLMGPLAGIGNKFFKSGFQSLNQALSFTSGAGFQSMASNALGGLLDQLGVGGAFSGELCGLMVDMVLKYLQCENPIEIPSLGSLDKGLNDLLPNNCAGKAAREALYKASNSQAADALAQKVTGGISQAVQGQFVPGN